MVTVSRWPQGLFRARSASLPWNCLGVCFPTNLFQDASEEIRLGEEVMS
jgi:hypothetical protein